MRLFHCLDCGHRMRLTGAVCGKCYAPKALYQRAAFWITLSVLSAGSALPLLAVSTP